MDYITKVADFEVCMLPNLTKLFGTFFPIGDRLLTAEYHDWLYLQNPYGVAKAIYVSNDDQWVGFMALVPVMLQRRGVTARAYFAVNVLVDPKHQGRNLFGRMITAACELAKSENVILLGHPNAAAHAFWRRKKMVFHQDLQPSLALPGLSRFTLRSHTVSAKDELAAFRAPLFEAIDQSERWKISATPEYISWRFIEHPNNKYIIRGLEKKGIKVGVQITKRMKPGVHLFIDQFVPSYLVTAAAANLSIFTMIFSPISIVKERKISAFALPWKKRIPFFATPFSGDMTDDAVSELFFSASDF